MSKDTPQLTDEEIAALAAERTQARVVACSVEIDAILKKHRCELQPVFEIRQGGMNGRIEIVPLG